MPRASPMVLKFRAIFIFQNAPIAVTIYCHRAFIRNLRDRRIIVKIVNQTLTSITCVFGNDGFHGVLFAAKLGEFPITPKRPIVKEAAIPIVRESVNILQIFFIKKGNAHTLKSK